MALVDVFDFTQAPPAPCRCHPTCCLAVSSVYAELPRCRGPHGTASCRRLVLVSLL